MWCIIIKFLVVFIIIVCIIVFGNFRVLFVIVFVFGGWVGCDVNIGFGK